MFQCIIDLEFHFQNQRIQRKGSNNSKDRLNNTMVFSEKMGDAYSDSQHMNDGIITVLSRDLAKSPYNLDIIKKTNSNEDIQRFKVNNRESDSIMSMHQCLPHELNQNDNRSSSVYGHTNRYSINNPTSFPSSKNIPNQNKRQSNFVRLDFGPNYRNSKMSVLSFNKQSTLQSIPEVPGEQYNAEMENNLNVINAKLTAIKRKSAFHGGYGQKNSSL